MSPLASIIEDLSIPLSDISLSAYPELSGLITDGDQLPLSDIVSHLLGNGTIFDLTIQVPDFFDAVNNGTIITPLTIGQENFFQLDWNIIDSIDDVVFETFDNYTNDFNATVSFTMTQNLGGGVTNPVDFGVVNFTTEITPVPDTPQITKIDTPDNLPNVADGVQYIGEFTIASNDPGESLWFDVLGVPNGAEIYTLDDDGNPEFKFGDIPPESGDGQTQSIDAPSAFNNPKTIKVGMVYNGITLPDDLDLKIRGRSIEGDLINEVGLDAATSYSSVQPLNVTVGDTTPTIAIAFTDDAGVNENSGSLESLLVGVEIAGDLSDYSTLGNPQTLNELINNLEDQGLPFIIDLDLGDGELQGATPNSDGSYTITESDSPLSDLLVQLTRAENTVAVRVTVPDIINDATNQDNTLTFGQAIGSVDSLPVADKPDLAFTINELIVADPTNPLVEIGDYTVTPNDDEEITLTADDIPVNATLVVLDDNGEQIAEFTPNAGSYTVDLNGNLQGTLALKFDEPIENFEDFAVKLQAIATEPGTDLSALSDSININIDLPDGDGSTGDDSTGGDGGISGTEQPTLTYQPDNGLFSFSNAQDSILAQSLVNDGDGGLREIGAVISGGDADEMIAVFSVLPDGTTIGNQERLHLMASENGTIQFFKIDGVSVDNLIDGGGY